MNFKKITAQKKKKERNEKKTARRHRMAGRILRSRGH
jgi:hypothetical protein